MGHRMNAGYLITDSIHIGTTEFVLGVSIAERSMFCLLYTSPSPRD